MTAFANRSLATRVPDPVAERADQVQIGVGSPSTVKSLDFDPTVDEAAQCTPWRDVRPCGGEAVKPATPSTFTHALISQLASRAGVWWGPLYGGDRSDGG
jgi:hypothetical protein